MRLRNVRIALYFHRLRITFTFSSDERIFCAAQTPALSGWVFLRTESLRGLPCGGAEMGLQSLATICSTGQWLPAALPRKGGGGMRTTFFQWAVTGGLAFFDIRQLANAAGTGEAFVWAVLVLATSGLFLQITRELLEGEWAE